MALSLIYLMFLPDIGSTFVDAAEVGRRRVVTRGREMHAPPFSRIAYSTCVCHLIFESAQVQGKRAKVEERLVQNGRTSSNCLSEPHSAPPPQLGAAVMPGGIATARVPSCPPAPANLPLSLVQRYWLLHCDLQVLFNRALQMSLLII